MKKFWWCVVVVSTTMGMFACANHPTGTDEFTELRLRIVHGDQQAGLPGGELPEPLAVKVTRLNERHEVPVPNYLVNFRVVDGGGSVFAGAALTSEKGLAIDYWTLGEVLGEQHVEVRSVNSSTGLKEVWGTFVATAIAAPEIVQLEQGGNNWSTLSSTAVGQTFTPLNGSFDSFSFWMAGEIGNVFEVFLYEWDSEVRAQTGSELWSSGPRTAPQGVGGVAGEVVFTPRVAFNPDLVYLLFVYQSAFPQVSIRSAFGNPYAGGQIVRAEFPTGTSPDDAFSRAHIAASENSFGTLFDEDMTFTAQFALILSPPPGS